LIIKFPAKNYPAFYNIIFEIQGDKWHANPNIYKPNDLITGLWVGELTASEIWKRDEIRKKHMESFGYTVYYIWEYDIRHNLPQVKYFIKNLVKK
jgi:G:T-mismatch repair DNA endonuclease (very short patch repair protein)